MKPKEYDRLLRLYTVAFTLWCLVLGFALLFFYRKIGDTDYVCGTILMCFAIGSLGGFIVVTLDSIGDEDRKGTYDHEDEDR